MLLFHPEKKTKKQTEQEYKSSRQVEAPSLKKIKSKIKILKYKLIYNVEKGNNTLYTWKINDIWCLSLGRK